MGLSQCQRVMKYYLMGFNILILIACAAGIGVGIWGLVSDYGAEEMEEITGTDLYIAGCIVIIIGAVIVAVIAFLGCLGAYMENTIMLGIYFVVMLLFLILFIVVAVLGFFFRDDLEDELADRMQETLTESYGFDDDVTDVWDKVQEELQCCGVRGDLNSDQSWFLWQSSRWFKGEEGERNGKYVPKSCCNTKYIETISDGLNRCQGLNAFKTEPIQKSTGNITKKNPALYDKGCVTELKDKIEEHAVAIGIVAVIVLIIMVTCIFFAVSLCTEAMRQKGKQ